MKKYGLMIHTADNVIIVTDNVEPGDEVEYLRSGEKKEVKALEHIPIYHKIAVRPIAEGEKVIKYGESIGDATQDIETGMYVHTHNLSSLAKGE